MWSPDGTRILYSSQAAQTYLKLPDAASRGPEVTDLFVYDVAKGFTTRLTHTLSWGLPGVLTNFGAWSPDGREVVFNNGTPGGASDLWVVGVDEGRPQRLTSIGRAYAPSWAPGKDVVFTLTDRDGDAGVRHVWTIDPQTKAARQVTTGRTEDRFPAWSWNGRTIGFSRGESASATRYRLTLVASDGSHVETITEGSDAANGDSMPSFTPR